MPTRENKSIRVCDILLNNIINQNNSDIFISTDTNDFYLNGSQYFHSNTIDIVNNDPFRLYNNVSFIQPNEAKTLICSELNKLLGNRIKGIIINSSNEDYTNDPKFKLLSDSGLGGSSPRMIVAQYKGLICCDDMIKSYETINNFKYDVIMKCRFDAMYDSNSKLNFNNYDFNKTDVFVPTIRSPIIYDFFAFGNSKGMTPYLRMYENLGCMLPNKMLMAECRRDGNIIVFGESIDTNKKCKICNTSDKISVGDVSISSEYHIYYLFNKLGIKYSQAGLHTFVYRYRNVEYDKTVDEIIRNELKLNNIKLINHSPGNKSESREF